MSKPQFSKEFLTEFETLLRWRRDVRRFTRKPLPDGLLDQLLDDACLAPSVGNSQPWRFIHVQTPALREQVRTIFEEANTQAATLYQNDERTQYENLKLEGLEVAPVHLAVCCDLGTEQGKGLGRQTMPETLCYSAVCAIHTLWLAARARGLGMGWLSIIYPERMHTLLDLPERWKLVAYLCLGYPEEESTIPELEKSGWQERVPDCRILHVK